MDYFNILKQLSKTNLEKVGVFFEELDNEFQIKESPKIIVDYLPAHCLPRPVKEKITEEYSNYEYREIKKRLQALNFLKRQGVIMSYNVDTFNHQKNKDSEWHIKIRLNIHNFKHFKLSLTKLTNKLKMHIKKTAIKNVIPLSISQDCNWRNITIRFINGHDVKIKLKDKIVTSDFKEMGFEDKRTRKPDKQWKLLQGLAEHNGEISWQSYPEQRNKNIRLTEQSFGYEADEKERGNKGFHYLKSPDSAKKTKQTLSKKLKVYFGIKEDPFFPYCEENSYKIKMNLLPA